MGDKEAAYGTRWTSVGAGEAQQEFFLIEKVFLKLGKNECLSFNVPWDDGGLL